MLPQQVTASQSARWTLLLQKAGASQAAQHPAALRPRLVCFGLSTLQRYILFCSVMVWYGMLCHVML